MLSSSLTIKGQVGAPRNQIKQYFLYNEDPICYIRGNMSVIRFEAIPYAVNGWTVLRLPEAASKQLPSRGQVMVKGTINDVSLHTALEPDGNGGHWLHIDKTMGQAAKATAGKVVVLAIESTKVWPEPIVPPDIQAGLVARPDTQPLWLRITPMARWEWIRWIGSTKQAQTRQRHIEVARSKLQAGARRRCCFNRSMCCVPEVSKNGVLLEPALA